MCKEGKQTANARDLLLEREMSPQTPASVARDPRCLSLPLTRTSYCDAGVAIKKFFSGKKELLPAKSGERGRRRRRGVRKEEGEWKGESTAGSERKERGRKREKKKKGCKDEAAAAPTKRDAASDGRRLATGDRVTLASPPEHDFSLSLSFPPSSVEDATA